MGVLRDARAAARPTEDSTGAVAAARPAGNEGAADGRLAAADAAGEFFERACRTNQAASRDAFAASAVDSIAVATP